MLKIRAQSEPGMVHTRGSMAWHDANTAARAARSSRPRIGVRMRQPAGGQAAGARGRKRPSGGTACQWGHPPAIDETA